MKTRTFLSNAFVVVSALYVFGAPLANAGGGQCINGDEANQVMQRMRAVQDQLSDKCENPGPSRLASHPCHDGDSPITEACGPLCPEPDDRQLVKSGSVWMSISPDPTTEQYCMVPRRKKALEAIPGGNISEWKASANFQALRGDWITRFRRPKTGAKAVLTRYRDEIAASIADTAHTPELDRRLPAFGNRTVRELLSETLESIRIYLVRGDELAGDPDLRSMRAQGVQESYNRMLFGCEHPDNNQSCRHAPPSEVTFSVNDLGTFLSGGDPSLVRSGVIDHDDQGQDIYGRYPPPGAKDRHGNPYNLPVTSNPHYYALEKIRDDVHDVGSDLYYRMNELDMAAGCRELRAEWSTLVARKGRFCSSIQHCSGIPDDYFTIMREVQALADQASAAILRMTGPKAAVAHPDTTH